MYPALKPTGQINCCLAKKVIELHGKGYDRDFSLVNDNVLLCVQDNSLFLLSTIQIKVIDQQYDCFSRTFKYIHTIDVDNGEKGLLITDRIVTHNMACRLAG